MTAAPNIPARGHQGLSMPHVCRDHREHGADADEPLARGSARRRSFSSTPVAHRTITVEAGIADAGC
jgi:hypothetical protein